MVAVEQQRTSALVFYCGLDPRLEPRRVADRASVVAENWAGPVLQEGWLTNVAADKHFSGAATPQWL